MHRAQESVAHVLRHHRKVHVGELGAAFIDALAQIRVRLVGSAEADGLGLRQGAVQRFAGGSAGQNADLKGFASGVKFLGVGGDGSGDVLGRASGGKAAESDCLFVFD